MFAFPEDNIGIVPASTYSYNLATLSTRHCFTLPHPARPHNYSYPSPASSPLISSSYSYAECA